MLEKASVIMMSMSTVLLIGSIRGFMSTSIIFRQNQNEKWIQTYFEYARYTNTINPMCANTCGMDGFSITSGQITTRPHPTITLSPSHPGHYTWAKC